MRPVLTDLCGLLNEHKSVLDDMLMLSQEEQRIIISGEAELLEDIVRREFKKLSQLNAIEKKRMELREKISAELGLSVQELNVSSIVERAEPDEREIIIKLQTELTSLLKLQIDINTENRELIEAHFEYTDTLMDLVAGSDDPLNNFYGGDGKTAPEKKKATVFIDSRA